MIMKMFKQAIDFLNKLLKKIYACESSCTKKYTQDLEKLYLENKSLLEWWKLKYYNEKSEEAFKNVYNLLKQRHDILLKMGFFIKKEIK